MSRDDTVQHLFDALRNNDLETVMNQFCPDDPPGNPTIPSVGLTQTPQSPNFTGRAQVRTLFDELLKDFRNFEFRPLAPWLHSSDGGVNRTTVQGNIWGYHVAKWKPGGHTSPPISNINPDPKHPHQIQGLPACAIFTFDASDFITNLSLYFDRYQMAKHLAPGGKFVTSIIKNFSVTISEDFE